MARTEKRNLQILMDKKTETLWNKFCKLFPECRTNEGRLLKLMQIANGGKS
jgi:hypothetical protein